MKEIFVQSTYIFLLSFVIVYIITPKIIKVVIHKSLMDQPNNRSSHINATPNLGGIAIYIALIFSFYFIEPVDKYNVLNSLIPGLTILFIIGLKDDLVVLSPITKLFAEIIASSFITFHEKFSIENFHGFLGIDHIPVYIAIPLEILVLITIINAYNLIDGLDGLASTIGVIIFSTFGVLFYITHEYYMLLLCVVLVASLLAFLRFNFSKNKKIFLGDTGSLIIGFMIGVMTLRFLSLSYLELNKLPFKIQNIPLVALTILIFPIFDLTRIIIIRLWNKKSPFQPDRNHTHHLLIDYLKLSHYKISLLIGTLNILLILSFSQLLTIYNQYINLIFYFIILFTFNSYLFHISSNEKCEILKNKIFVFFKKK